MTSSMEQLYQQVILDHAKHPHGRGLGGAAEGARTGESHQVNPTCGDEVTLQVDVDDAGVVRGLRWEGQGCSISQASVSVLHDLVLDQPLPTVDGLAGSFRALMQSRGAAWTTTPSRRPSATPRRSPASASTPHASSAPCSAGSR